MNTKTLLLSLSVAALLGSAFAQPGGQPGGPPGQPGGRQGGFRGQFGGGGGMMGNPQLTLLQRTDVQKELKITDEQRGKLTTMRQQAMEKMRGAMQELGNLSPEERQTRMQELRAEMDKANNPATVLSPEQMKRLKELALQWEGPFALARPEIAKEVGLTSEQQTKINGIRQDMMESLRPQGQPGGQPGSDFQARIKEAREKAEKAIEALLTTEQKQKWQSLTGAAFTFEGGRNPGLGMGGRRLPGGFGPGGPGGRGPGGF